MSERLSNAAQAIQVNLFREGLLAHSTPWDTLSPATQQAWLSAVESALPHLEAHFREVMAQRLEAAATIKRRDGGACFKFAAAFLRESDR